MATPTLEPEEYQYLEDGILLNGDEAVPFIDITQVTGLDATDLDVSEHTREQIDGGYIDAFYENMRKVILDGTIYADVFNMEEYLDSLKANYQPSMLAQPFFVGTDAGVRVVYGKSLGAKYDKTTLRRTGRAAVQLQIVCEDPRIYSPIEVSAEATLGSAVVDPGREYPKSYTYGYGTTAAANSLVVDLEGNREQPGIIRIEGPITNPVVTHSESGTEMSFIYTLPVDDFIEIDLNNRTVLLNGGTGIRSSMTLMGDWYLLQPGTNTFDISGTAAISGTTKLIVTAHAAAWR